MTPSRDPGSPQPGGDPAAGDVDLLVAALHRLGPSAVHTLLEQPEFSGWSPVRMEQAVVGAWSDGKVFVNADDAFVAL